MPAKRHGVSLPELLVVIDILAVFLGLLLPAVQRVRESAARAASANDKKQLALAHHHYAADCGDGLFSYTEWAASPRGPYGVRPGSRRASFADGGRLLGGKNEGDVYPVTDPAAGVTRPSRPGATFQVAPTVWIPNERDANGNLIPTLPPGGCDNSVPQTPFRAGLQVAMADGSVKTYSPHVSPDLFWAAVTPAGGEVSGGE